MSQIPNIDLDASVVATGPLADRARRHANAAKAAVEDTLTMLARAEDATDAVERRARLDQAYDAARDAGSAVARFQTAARAIAKAIRARKGDRP